MIHGRLALMIPSAMTIDDIQNELRKFWDNDILDKWQFFDLINELHAKSFEEGFKFSFEISFKETYEQILKEKCEKIMKERYEENVKKGCIITILALYKEKNITREDAIKHLGITPAEFEHLLSNQETAVQ